PVPCQPPRHTRRIGQATPRGWACRAALCAATPPRPIALPTGGELMRQKQPRETPPPEDLCQPATPLRNDRRCYPRWFRRDRIPGHRRTAIQTSLPLTHRGKLTAVADPVAVLPRPDVMVAPQPCPTRAFPLRSFARYLPKVQ